MPRAVRVVLTVAAGVATFYFVFWVPCSLIWPSGGPMWVPWLASMACAVLAGRYVWRHSAAVPSGLVTCIGMGALVTGAVGFLGGFFGPLIFAPGANQGPMLGLFITGPLGFIFGAVGGAIYWVVRRR